MTKPDVVVETQIQKEDEFTLVKTASRSDVSRNVTEVKNSFDVLKELETEEVMIGEIVCGNGEKETDRGRDSPKDNG